jgi:SRSO17 transposase
MTSEQMSGLQPALRSYLQAFRDCFRKEVTFGYLETYVVGLMSDIKRKSIEPIALAAEVPVRTLQEFVSSFRWDHARAQRRLHRMVAERHGCAGGLGVIDASGHLKQGEKTPGVQRQWCGETGKVDNCVVGQHLLYTDNDGANPFGCVLCSDLFLPEAWDNDPSRRREAKIPAELHHRSKGEIALEQVRSAVGNGVRFSYLVFDEDYGNLPHFWRGLDAMGQWGVGEVRSNFLCWTREPACHSLRSEHSPHEVRHLAAHSPAFYRQAWKEATVKDTTRGPHRWRYKAARVQMTNTREGKNVPTDRRYWLIVAESLQTKETKYILSNAPESVPVTELLRVAMGRWHIEKWFELAKQEAGLGAFEVRTYDGLIRHWLCSSMAMYFLAEQTKRLRGEKSGNHSGTGGQRGQHAGGENLEDVAAILGGPDTNSRVPAMAQ